MAEVPASHRSPNARRQTAPPVNSPGRVIPLGQMRSKTNGARMVLAIFTMAMFYTSVCTTTCAIGVCPNEVQQTAGHDCEQSSSHHSGQPGHEAPESPDCSKHAHPGVFVARSGNVSQFQLSIVGHLQLSATALGTGHDLRLSTATRTSDLAPPFASNLPLHQQISVLRI